MSQKIATLAHQSKQIPRIFRRRQKSSVARSDYESPVSTENVLAAVRASDGPHDNCDHEVCDQTSLASREMSRSQIEKLYQHQMNGLNIRTVEDIEKWLKNSSEPISNIGMSIKSNSQTNIERYLAEPFSEAFFEKESLSTDIDLSPRKLNISYDTIFNELHHEKFLPACEKDDISLLTDLQLDSLDELPYYTDDMILTNEILPSTSAPPPCNNTNVNTKELIIRLQETINKFNDNNKSIEVAQTQSQIRKEVNGNYQFKDSRLNFQNYESEDFHNNSLPNSIQDFSAENISYQGDKNFLNYCTNFENESTYEQTTESESLNMLPSIQTRSKTYYLNRKNIDSTNESSFNVKSKFQPSIIKRKKKLTDVKNTYISENDNVMSVVAISNNRHSNITQIFFNANKNNEILKDNSLKCNNRIRKKSTTSDSCESLPEENTKVRPLYYFNQQEIIITKALEEVGITDNVLQYIISDENIKIWQCHQDQCGRQFAKLCSLKAHLLTHFGIRPFKCDFDGCLWAFYSDFKLKRHKETHLKKKDYMCSLPGCKRRFTTIYNLASHEKLHTRPNRVICQVPGCTAKFQTKRALDSHMKTHDESLAPFVCSYEGCGKRYFNSNALMSHQRCHNHSQTDITCTWPDCGKKFDQPCRLKTHMRSHTGHKPYACTFKGCKWAFSTASKLKRHQKKHTNERKFICDIGDCNKAFMRSEHLKEHKLTHSEGRFFQCHICASSFSAKSSLYVHIKKHANKDFVSRPHRQPKKKTVKKKVVSKKTEVYCSRVQPIRITINRVKTESAADSPKSEQETSGEKNKTVTEEKAVVTTHGISNSVEDENVKNIQFCPVDSCIQWFSTKSSLRMHLTKDHQASHSEILNNVPEMVSSSPLTQGDLTTYNSPTHSINKSKDKSVTTINNQVFQKDEVKHSTIQENTTQQSEAQSPLVLKDIKMSSPRVKANDEYVPKNKGSARTAFTCKDVLNLKPDRGSTDLNVGVSDVVLGVADLEDSLLLSDDLSSAYCHEDIEVPGYQILLLDTGPTDSEINMRDLN